MALPREDFGEEVVIPVGGRHFAAQVFLEWKVLESRDGESS